MKDYKKCCIANAVGETDILWNGSEEDGDVKAHLHGSPRLINTVESTKVNCVNSSFLRK